MVPVSFGRTVTGGVLPLGVITSCDQPIWDNLPLVATECDGSSRPSKQTGVSSPEAQVRQGGLRSQRHRYAAHCERHGAEKVIPRVLMVANTPPTRDALSWDIPWRFKLGRS